MVAFPEGVKGAAKTFRDRYRLQRFGRGGAVRLALEADVPIVPVAIVGAEEAHPILFKVETPARALGLPFLPVTPTFPWLGPLGALPLPVEVGDLVRRAARGRGTRNGGGGRRPAGGAAHRGAARRGAAPGAGGAAHPPGRVCLAS